MIMCHNMISYTRIKQLYRHSLPKMVKDNNLLHEILRFLSGYSSPMVDQRLVDPTRLLLG